MRFQCVRLQNETRSSPPSKIFVSGPVQTRSSLVINAFVCGVILCLEVSNRGSLVASDDAFVCSVISYSEVKIDLENPPK